MTSDRRHNGDPGYKPTRPEVVAEHPYVNNKRDKNDSKKK